LLQAQYVREDETITQILWNSNEAYLFSGVRRNGWSGSYAELAWQVAQELFGKPPDFSANHSWLVVVKIDANGIDQYIEEGAEFFTRSRSRTLFIEVLIRRPNGAGGASRESPKRSEQGFSLE
jgi:hypothetical protein